MKIDFDFNYYIKEVDVEELAYTHYLQFGEGIASNKLIGDILEIFDKDFYASFYDLNPNTNLKNHFVAEGFYENKFVSKLDLEKELLLDNISPFGKSDIAWFLTTHTIKRDGLISKLLSIIGEVRNVPDIFVDSDTNSTKLISFLNGESISNLATPRLELIKDLIIETSRLTEFNLYRGFYLRDKYNALIALGDKACAEAQSISIKKMYFPIRRKINVDAVLTDFSSKSIIENILDFISSDKEEMMLEIKGWDYEVEEN